MSTLERQNQEIAALQEKLKLVVTQKARRPYNPQKLIRDLVYELAHNPTGAGKLCDFCYHVAAIARDNPKKLRIIEVVLNQFDGSVPTDGTKVCAEELQMSDRQVRNYFQEIKKDKYFGDVIQWQHKRARKKPDHNSSPA